MREPSATPPARALDERTERSLLDLFGLLGELVPVEERLMDAATAISGCGPAFFALVAESLVDAGVKEGLDARQAARLAMTTMGGTAELMRRRDGDAVGLRRAVTSPGRRDGGRPRSAGGLRSPGCLRRRGGGSRAEGRGRTALAGR